MKNFLILNLIVTLTVIELIHAEPLTATKGLEKIKINLENAKKNKLEYDKNLEVVKSNVLEVQKAKEATLAQKKLLSSELSKNTDSLKKVVQQERTLSAFIAKENDKIALETKQIEQLQSMINQIKKNQEQRNLLITDYQNQLASNTNHKKAWKDREDQLKEQEAKTLQSLRGISSEESNWINKKKKYESEVKHWSAETDKQQKIHDVYEGLTEQK